MPTPILLALAYLAINLALVVWIERERASERAVRGWVGAAAGLVRYGPPLAGAIYLVALTGDWLFVGFVLAFFLGAGWLMVGLLAYTDLGPDGRRDVRRDDF